jgi:hypothetical protein
MQMSTALFLDPMPEPPGMIRAKTRAAIERMVMEPTSAAEAARAAGLRDDTLPKALAKPEVMAFVTSLKDWKDRRDTALRQGYLGEALDKARDLMLNSSSEQTQARMIEFLHRALAPQDDAGKPAPVLNLTQNIGPAYAYKPSSERTSGPATPQAIEGKAESLDDSDT